jgi:hypothetical protein
VEWKSKEKLCLVLSGQSVVVTVVMWESRRDLQGVWEGWKAAFGFPGFPYAVISMVSLWGRRAKWTVENVRTIP